MSDPLLDPEDFRARFRELAAGARELSPLPEAARIAARIQEAEEAARSADGGSRPLVFALLGATGVGKSSLFNALVGHPASPVSSVERCYTKRPHVAVGAGGRPAVAFLERYDPVWCDGVPDDLPAVLVDTPDIDGMIHENWETARAVVQDSDVVVFVTDPDRRANLAPLRELRAWAGRKHWVFVLNKADQLADPAAVRDDWDERLREAGFDPRAQNRLVLSVRGPDTGDLELLRRLVLQPRTESDRRSIVVRNRLGRDLHALSDDLLAPIRRRVEELDRLEAAHLETIRSIYRAGLATTLAATALRSYLRSRTWLAVAGQGSGLLAPALWIRARFAALSQSFAIARLTRGSLLGLAAAAGVAVFEAARGLAGLRRAIDLMGPDVRNRLEAVARTARRQLEDRGLARLLEPAAAEVPAATPDQDLARPVRLAAGPIQLDVPLTGSMARSLGRLGLVAGQDDDLLAELYDHTERLAAESARRALGWFWLAVGNLLPLAALGHILVRIGRSWVDADYLPLPFYLMALAVFAASCLPGFWLISHRVARLNRALDLDELVGRIGSPAATAPLRLVRDRLAGFLAAATQLRGELIALRESLGREASELPFAVTAVELDEASPLRSLPEPVAAGR